MPKNSKYQTISQFMRSPFNRDSDMEKNMKYEKAYNEFVRNNRIYVAGFTQIEDSYYIHIKVPSESQKQGKYEYDVVLRFFSDRPEVLKGATLEAYYIQFFSNSPGFMYRYAVLYKKEGYLIEALYNKLDPEFKDKLPEKTNPNMEVSYDKSIYYACKYISEKRFRYLHKFGAIIQKKKKPENFFLDITDFKSVKLDQELMKVERDLGKEVERYKRSRATREAKRRVISGGKIGASKMTSGLIPGSVKRAVKKVAKGKIRPGKSTKKK